MTDNDTHKVKNTQQMFRPSPFVASVVPNKLFNPQHHVAFGDIFLENSMSGVEAEIEAITRGAGLPDRADQGWGQLDGKDVLQVVEQWFAGAAADLRPGTGICAVQVEAISDEPVDLYLGNECLWIGLPRISVQSALTRLRSRIQSTDITVTDETDSVARIAVMGPDSRTLLQALGVSEEQLQRIGDHIEIEIIHEPVRVCLSDFAGPHGYEFIIPSELFNMILAVICSWGVRLEMNLVPVGWDAVQATARQHRKRNR